MHGVHKVIHICWVNRNHYVQLLMHDDSSSLPPIQRSWREAADNLCRNLKTHFEAEFLSGIDYIGYNDHKVITPSKMQSI